MKKCFILTSIVLFAPLLFGCSGEAFKSAEHTETPPPNVILLVTDDQRYDALGYAGNEIVQTPHLDALASSGVYFDNAYVTTSICAVSRATLLSGQYARRHGVNDFATSFSDSAFAFTYPAVLRRAGYRTGFIGKYGVGSEMPEQAFDYWRGFAGQGRYEQQDSLGNDVHLTRLIGEQAITFLEMQSPDHPFVLSISFKAPHVQDGDPRQFIYDPAYDNLYEDISIPEPVTASPRYWTSEPEFFRRDNEARSRWEIRFSTPERYQESVKGYYRLITGIDDAVGRIREALDRLGLADNTVIVFTSDNGFYLGEHGLAGKWYGHEESVRVPLFIFDPRHPEVERGLRRTAIALNIDIAPTVIDLAGIPVPDQMQGRSLVPLLHGEKVAWRKDFFYEHLFDYRGRIPRSEGVIGGRYKYLRYLDPDPDYEVLYDLRVDPHETKNFAADPAYRDVLDGLRERYKQLKQQAN